MTINGVYDLIHDGKTGLLKVQDVDARRNFNFQWTNTPLVEQSIAGYLCGRKTDGDKATETEVKDYMPVYYYKVYGATRDGFHNLRRVDFWGNFSLTMLFNAGDSLFYRRKPCRSYIMTAAQWEQAKKHLGAYDKMTATHEAYNFERLARAGREAYISSNAVKIPSGYRWKL